MKNIFHFTKVVLLFLSMATFAQVKIGDNPSTVGASSALELESTTRALLITRVANTAAIVSPVNGMLIYDISENCLKGYENGAWTECASSNRSSKGTALVSAYSCATGTAGTLNTGTAVSGVTQTITATVISPGTYKISTTANGVTFAASGTFAGTGAQNIVLTATGTPVAAGTNTFTLNTDPNCSFSRTTQSLSSNGTGVVSAYSCSTASAGTLTAGTAVSGVTQTITATVTTVGTYSISTTANGVTFSASGTFASTGAQNIVLSATGSPTATGTTTFTLNTTPNCSFSRTVAVSVPTNATGSGSLVGKTCFDVAVSNDNANGCGALSGRTAQKADFTLSATNTQTYTFTPVGTVSNVRFVYINTNGTAITAIAGGNSGNNISTAVTATVTYANTLNTAATGLTGSNAIRSDIYVVYNNSANNSAADLQIKVTASIKDCECCGAFVAAGVYKLFLCHNLGADTSLDPNVPVVGVQGAYIQWGRRGPNTTGNASVDWQTAANTINFAAAPTAINANAAAVSGWSTTRAADYSWRTAGGAKTANDPCPAGYRVPTREEWAGLINNNTASSTGTFTGGTTEYGSATHFGPNSNTKALTLPAAGYRNINGGGPLFSRGQYGYYWSSTDNGDGGSAIAVLFNITNGDPNNGTNRGFGASIRCIAE